MSYGTHTANTILFSNNLLSENSNLGGKKGGGGNLIKGGLGKVKGGRVG